MVLASEKSSVEIIPKEAVSAHTQADRQSTILLVDDNADMLNYMKNSLEQENWTVTAVADGQAALDSALAEPRINLLVM